MTENIMEILAAVLPPFALLAAAITLVILILLYLIAFIFRTLDL